MLERLTINLSTQERQALELIAKAEIRDIREQARFLLRLELERRGLLPIQESENPSKVLPVQVGAC